MPFEQEPREQTQQTIEFYQKTKRGKILRLLTLNDITFWGADRLLGVVYALYATQHLADASATHIGFTFTMREICVALLSSPIGSFLDKHKGRIDEVYALSLSGVILGLSYTLFTLAKSITSAYILMFFVGIAHAINMASWRVLFYGSIAEGEKAQTGGAYQTYFSLSIAFFAGISGYIADHLGFPAILLIGGIMALVGGVIPFLIKRDIQHYEQHHSLS